MTERNETHVQVNRPLREEFTGWIADHQWDVALLQETPPLWFRAIGARAAADGVRVLTSRNVLPPLQRLAANVNTDLIASWEGGSNQLFVRKPGEVLEHRTLTLATRPERRRMVWARVRLPAGETVCFANLHASAGLPEKATGEVLAAAASAVEWSGDDPLVFGGDLNLRPGRNPLAFTQLRERHRLGDPTGPNAIDHVLARDLEVVERPRRSRPRSASSRNRRPAPPAVRPRAGHRDLRGEIVPESGEDSRAPVSGDPGGSRWRSVAAAEVREAGRSPGRAGARPPARVRPSSSRASSSKSRASSSKRSAAAKKGGQARGRQQKARKAAKTTSRTASRGARRAGVEAKTVAEFREALRKNLIGPMEMVLLSRERIEEVLGEAVERGRMTAADAQGVASGLLDRGRKQTNDVLKDLEQLLGRGGTRSRAAHRVCAGQQAERSARHAARHPAPAVAPCARHRDRWRRPTAPAALPAWARTSRSRRTTI